MGYVVENFMLEDVDFTNFDSCATLKGFFSRKVIVKKSVFGAQNRTHILNECIVGVFLSKCLSRSLRRYSYPPFRHHND